MKHQAEQQASEGTIDHSSISESAERLETPSADLRRRCRNYNLKNVGLGVLVLLMGAGGAWILVRTDDGDGLVSGLMTRIAFGAALLAFVAGIIMAIMFLIRLARGVPKAPTAPLSTVEKFFSSVVGDGSVDPAVFALMLDQAKAEFGGVGQFIQYYDDIHKTMRESLKTRARCDAVTINYSMGDIRELEDNQATKRYSVEQKARVAVISQAANNANKYLGTGRITSTCEVAEFGGRWYMVSGKWKGNLVSFGKTE